MEFEWDPVKARDNEAKHKVSFSEATEIFADNISLIIDKKGFMLNIYLIPEWCVQVGI